MMYEEGHGVTQDYATAVMWYHKAADQSYSGGQEELGNLYFEGRGVPQDYILAYMWWNLAAAVSWENTYAIKSRDKVAAMMTPEQIAEAQKLAREWKPTSGQ
jgi:TPR repeat protein